MVLLYMLKNKNCFYEPPVLNKLLRHVLGQTRVFRQFYCEPDVIKLSYKSVFLSIFVQKNIQKLLLPTNIKLPNFLMYTNK